MSSFNKTVVAIAAALSLSLVGVSSQAGTWADVLSIHSTKIQKLFKRPAKRPLVRPTPVQTETAVEAYHPSAEVAAHLILEPPPEFKQKFFVRARTQDVLSPARKTITRQENNVGESTWPVLSEWMSRVCSLSSCSESVKYHLGDTHAGSGSPPGQRVFPCPGYANVDYVVFHSTTETPYSPLPLGGLGQSIVLEPELTALFPKAIFQSGALTEVGGDLMMQNVLASFHPYGLGQAFIVNESSVTPHLRVTVDSKDDEWIVLKVETDFESLDNIPFIFLDAEIRNIKPVGGATRGRFEAELFRDEFGSWRNAPTLTFSIEDGFKRPIRMTIPTAWLTEEDGRLLTPAFGGSGGSFSGPIFAKAQMFYSCPNRLAFRVPGDIGLLSWDYEIAPTTLRLTVLDTSTQDVIRIAGEYAFRQPAYSPESLEFPVGEPPPPEIHEAFERLRDLREQDRE